MLRFHTPAHRTGRADFPHPALRLASLTNTRRLRCISVVTPRTSPSSMASKVLSVTAESLMELIGKANLRTLGLFQEHARSQAPFLDRHYPASTVLRACPPPQTAQPAPHGVLVESHDLSPLGLPVFRRFSLPCMPTPLPRRNRWMLSLSCPTTTAFPKKEIGGDRSASALSFSRPAQRSLTFRPAWSLSHLKVTRYTRVLQRICYLLRRPGCFRPSDRLAGWDSHP